MTSQPQTHTQEVRLAIVLYGGVSLAIYINGVVQELLRLVKSTSGEPIPERGTEKVYRKLATVVDRGVIPTEYPEDGREILTKFKIDIISGTSAGGINGIFLAKALANEADLAPIQTLWFDKGDIEKLLNKKPASGKTESLLNSRYMFEQLLDAFDKMDTGGRSGVSRPKTDSRRGDEIDLFATTTDIEGIPVPIQLFDSLVYERRFRNVFHLRYAEGERNDFQPDNNPFLAFASRCTSSFPFAFEPMQLCNIDDVLKSHKTYAKKKYCMSPSSRWQKFYTNYLEGVFPGSTPFPQRSFGDGGYLNNAPFSFAVDALLARQAAVPVDRKLIYVEPSPAHPEEERAAGRPPNAVENSIDALVTIPGYQTIRNDLMRVLDRNRAASRVNKVIREIEDRIQSERPVDSVPEGDIPEMRPMDLTNLSGYYQMRSSEVTDQLTLMVARMNRIEEGSAHFKALRALIRSWRRLRYRDRLAEFLADFDLPYRIRRLRFVLRKLDSLTGNHGEAQAIRPYVAAADKKFRGILARLLEIAEPDDVDTPKFDPNQAQHGTALTEAQQVDKARAGVSDALPPRDRVLNVLFDIVGMEDVSSKTRTRQTPLTTEPIRRSDTESLDIETLYDQRAGAVLDERPEVGDAMNAAAAKLLGLLQSVTGPTHDHLMNVFAGEAMGKLAKGYYHFFDLFDSVQFPMTFGTNVGEADNIEIIRICPEDAPSLVPVVEDRRTKLKGLAVAHFGAFLDRDWRVNDLLWGRLDTAERLITALLPANSSEALRNRLIDEAHNEIFHEFDAAAVLGGMAANQAIKQWASAKLTKENVRTVVNAVQPPLIVSSRDAHRKFMKVWSVVVPSRMDPEKELKAVAGSTQIFGRLLETLSDNGALKKQSAWVASVGRAFWGVVELSVPRSFGTLLGRYWQSLLLLISAILIFSGLVSGQSAVTGVGWACFGIAIALLLIRTALGSFMRGGSLVRLIRSVLVAVLCGIFALGCVFLYWVSNSKWDNVKESLMTRSFSCPSDPCRKQ